MNIEIIAISRDMAPSQQKFKETVGAKNTFLSDVDATVIKRFDAFNETTKGVKRYYFLIDENGKIIWRSVNSSLIPIDTLLPQLAEAIKSHK